MFQRILVANRGEIALRVIRACKELGVEVVAVYSQADRDAPYLELADRAICIGKAPSADSYLNIPRLIAAAEVADVQAIHPGYGFLSENPHFAEICRSCNFEFIGPPHEAIRKMGLKTEAKEVAAAAKVACVPGSDGAVASDAEAHRAGPTIGYPVLIKAAAGGGGKGMRVCPRRGEPRRVAPDGPQRGRGRVQELQRLPREVHRPPAPRRGPDPGRYPRQRRSTAGTATARSSAGTRSSSRRRPPPTLPLEVRTSSARPPSGCAKAVGYVNAGTCEFLVDADNRFYFIEVNARIQVEHPVTEMVTGIDLVKQQIRIAAGEPLPFARKTSSPRPRDRVPDQLRRPGQRLPSFARPDHRPARSRRPRRAVGLARPGRLHRPAQLRLAPGQAHRPRRRPAAKPSPGCAGHSTNWSSRASRRPSRCIAGSSATQTSSRGESTRPGSSGN